MAWGAIQAIAELVAAGGVILSLVYLSRQIRENTQSVRTAANQDLMTAFNDVTSFAGNSRHGARIYRHMVGARWHDLDEDERSAARLTLLQVMRVFEQAHLQYRAGFLEGDVWDGWRRQMALSMGMPGLVDAWPAIRQVVNADFASFVDSLATEAPAAIHAYAESWRDAGVSVQQKWAPDRDAP